MWMCFQRLDSLGTPTEFAIFGEVVTCDQLSVLTISTPFRDGSKELLFVPHPKHVGRWVQVDFPTAEYVINLVLPGRPSGVVPDIDGQGQKPEFDPEVTA